MSRRALPGWAAAVLAAAVPAAAAAAVTPRARAIVLLSIDDLRADEAQGAAFDRLRREAVEFTSADAAATWTLPSHATMLTGLLPAEHGAGTGPGRDAPLPPGVPYAPELLRRAGYAAGGFVQAAYLGREFGFARGFDEYRDYRRGLRTGGWAALKPAFPEALDWARARAQRPLFLFVHDYAVHLYQGLPDAPPRSGPFVCPPPVDFSVLFQDGPARSSDAAGCAQARYNYRNAVFCAGADVDALLSGLDQALPKDATMVIVTSDHGESLCDHGDAGRRFHAGPPHLEQVRVPLFIRFPGGAGAGTRVERAVSLADVAATILAAGGVRAPAGLAGRPLGPGGPAADGPVFSQGDTWTSARRGELRLTRFEGGEVRADRAGETRRVEPGDPELAALGRDLDAEDKRAAGLRARFGVAASTAPAALGRDLTQALRAEGYRR